MKSFPTYMRASRFFAGIWKPLLGVLLVLLVIHGTATFITGRRLANEIAAIKAKGEPVSAAELAGPPIPDSENGAVIYERIFKTLPQRNLKDPNANDDGSRLLDHPENPQYWVEARAIIARSNNVLDMVRVAQSKPGCRFKANWQDGSGALFPYLSRVRRLGRFLVVKAMVDAKDGRVDSSAEDIQQAYKLTDSIKDDPCLIHLLVRLNIAHIVSKALSEIVQSQTMDERHARDLFNTLSEIDLSGHAIIAIRGERASAIYDFDQIRDGRLSLTQLYGGDEPPTVWAKCLPYYAWRPFLNMDESIYLGLMGCQIDAWRYPYRMSTPKLAAMDQSFQDLPWYAVASKIFTPVFGKGLAKRDSGQAEINGSQILMALIAFKDRYHSYPQTLDECRAKLGWKVPEDPFSGKDFIYRREGNGFLFYSIGENLRDDGGINTPPTPGTAHKAEVLRPEETKDDIVWMMDR
jgi:hypothetical protein